MFIRKVRYVQDYKVAVLKPIGGKNVTFDVFSSQKAKQMLTFN